MSHIYDAHETLAVLRRVVEAKGADYVYEPPLASTCLYWDRENNCPSCLVGHVLAQLGYPAPPEYVETCPVNTAYGEGLLEDPRVVEYFRDKFSLDALRVLSAAQMAQDGGSSWGRALEKAGKRYAELTRYAGLTAASE